MITNSSVEAQLPILPYFVPQPYMMQGGQYLMRPDVPMVYFQPYYYNQPTSLAYYSNPTTGQATEPQSIKPPPTADSEENEQDEEGPAKKNIRNIIPNIARKILSFVSSPQSRELIGQLFPQFDRKDYMKFYNYVSGVRKKLNCYIGNKDLLKIWYGKARNSKTSQYQRMIRILSKYFLERCCVSSILLSKRMKPQLKLEHLRYRRRILKVLAKGARRSSS